MVDFTNKANMALADKINKSVDLEFKTRVYFALAYSMFIKIKQEVADKAIVNRLNPIFISIVSKSVNTVNELAAVDTPVLKDMIYKFSDFENVKIDSDYLGLDSIYGLFKIEAVFGSATLEIVNKDLACFKSTSSLAIGSLLFNNDLTKIILGE